MCFSLSSFNCLPVIGPSSSGRGTKESGKIKSGESIGLAWNRRTAIDREIERKSGHSGQRGRRRERLRKLVFTKNFLVYREIRFEKDRAFDARTTHELALTRSRVRSPNRRSPLKPFKRNLKQIRRILGELIREHLESVSGVCE